MVASGCNVGKENQKIMDNFINTWRNCAMENQKGVIYILTNPSFPDYVKIGYVDDIERSLNK